MRFTNCHSFLSHKSQCKLFKLLLLHTFLSIPQNHHTHQHGQVSTSSTHCQISLPYLSPFYVNLIYLFEFWLCFFSGLLASSVNAKSSPLSSYNKRVILKSSFSARAASVEGKFCSFFYCLCMEWNELCLILLNGFNCMQKFFFFFVDKNNWVVKISL